MKLGDRVQVIALWSSFFGQRGTITQTTPHIMILLVGDTVPIRVGAREVVPDDPRTHFGGAE